MKLVIDGNNLAFRANVTTELTTSKGEKVSAIYGTLKMLQSYIKPSDGRYKNKLLDSLKLVLDEDDLLFSDIIMCWDAGHSKFRKSLYPEYKAQRMKKREERTLEEQEDYKQFMRQMDELHTNLPKFNVKSLKFKGWEGDDLIYVVTQLMKDDICVIVSTDKDMLQLVSDKVFVWSPFKEKLITPKNFEFEVGVQKSLYLDYRVMVGDSSDNIVGLKGIGDKTAKSLLAQYGSLNGVIANSGKLTPAKKKTFEEGLGIIDRNRKLMDLRYVDYSDIKESVERILNEETEFDGKAVKMFLASKQFVSILSDYLSWSTYFKMLGK